MPRKFNLDDLVGAVVDRWSPATAGVSLWASGLLVFPIDEKVIGIKAFLLIGLPLMVAAGGTHQINLVILLTLHEQFGIHIAGIHNMLLRQQVFVLETLMDEGCSGIIRDWGRSRFYMGNEMGTPFVTGFSQMDFIAHPSGTPLFAVMRLDIVG